MPAPSIEVRGLASFELDLRQFGNVTVPEASLALQKKLALDLLTKIVLRNPVGNPDLWQTPPPPGYVGGRSRGNWQLRREVTDNQVDRIDPDGTATISAGTGNMLSITKPFGIIWIFNNVPYIIRLEHGWSSQAPQGMVAQSLAEIQAFNQ